MDSLLELVANPEDAMKRDLALFGQSPKSAIADQQRPLSDLRRKRREDTTAVARLR